MLRKIWILSICAIIFVSSKRIESTLISITAKGKAKNQPMQKKTSRRAVSISEEDRLEIHALLSQYGAVTEMKEKAKLSRRAIENLKDRGRAERTTIKKAEKYFGKKFTVVTPQTVKAA